MNPYETLPETAFWRTAIAAKSMFDISGLWQPKGVITPEEPVSTYGSCFAQHIGRALEARQFNWLVTEPAPQGCPAGLAGEYNYGVFSSRTGNIYTTSLLRRWTEWALGIARPPAEIWERDGRFIDPFRPQIEPEGFASPAELVESRAQAIESFRLSITRARHLIFTMGLTESWFDVLEGAEYPMCPGTIAGEHSPERHRFVNQSYEQVKDELEAALANIRRMNAGLRVLLTVSPVPLTATASGRHVLVATQYSKSVLRAVAGRMCETHEDVDYFPSYEIINGTPFEGVFFEPNKRSVHPRGVAFVMDAFFAAMPATARRLAKPTSSPRRAAAAAPAASHEVCEEALLEAFGPR